MTEADQSNWYSNDSATFGDRIAAARDASQMSQKELAKRLGIALKTLEGWENDLAEPRANKLQTLSGLLNVSIPWLLTGEGEGLDAGDPDTGAEVAELLRELRVLRTQVTRTAEQMGVLEKRLKAALQTQEA